MRGRLPRSFGDSMDRADMKRTVHECVSRLCDLAKSGDEEWLVHVDQIVNEYLAEDAAAAAERLSRVVEFMIRDALASVSIAGRLTSVGAPHVMGVNKNKNAMHKFPGRF